MNQGIYQQNGEWHIDGIAITTIAHQYETPCYVYSQSVFTDAYKHIKSTFSLSKPHIHYAVKTNDNLFLLRLLVDMGAGFDVVSIGELYKVLEAGGEAKNIVFSGVGKKQSEITQALNYGVYSLNIESESELYRVIDCAEKSNTIAPVAIRITLEVDGNTHQYLTTGTSDTKFGVVADNAQKLAKIAHENNRIDFLGFSCHVGSQISNESIFLDLAEKMAEQVNNAQAANIPIKMVDMGGGFAIDYNQLQHPPLNLSCYDKKLSELFGDKTIIIEPGRSISAGAGLLLTTIEYIKTTPHKKIWVVDAAMNDLIRPALYGAYHPIRAAIDNDTTEEIGDVVGPVCESADVFLKNCQLAAAAGDILIIFNAGAYGEVLASNYNCRLKPSSILVNKGESKIIRRAQTFSDLIKFEKGL